MNLSPEIQAKLDKQLDMLRRDSRVYWDLTTAFTEVAKSKERSIAAIGSGAFKEAMVESEFAASWLSKARDILARQAEDAALEARK